MHVQAVFCSFHTCFTSPSCATWALLLLLGCHTLLFWCLHGISSCVPNVVPVSHICLETPRAAAEQFPQQSSKLSYFFNPPQKPRNLYQLTQLLAPVLKAEVQGVQAKSLQLEGIVLLFILEAQMQLILVFSLLVSPIPRNEILALCI